MNFNGRNIAFTISVSAASAVFFTVTTAFILKFLNDSFRRGVDSITLETFSGVLLGTTAIILAAIALIITFVAFFGWNNIVEKAEEKASKIASEEAAKAIEAAQVVAKQEANRIAETIARAEIKNQIKDGARAGSILHEAILQVIAANDKNNGEDVRIEQNAAPDESVAQFEEEEYGDAPANKPSPRNPGEQD